MHTTEEPRRERSRSASSTPVPALVLVWSAAAPHRAGEVFLPLAALATRWVVGRGDEPGRDGAARLLPVRQRPGATTAAAAFADPALSREALLLEHGASGLFARPGRADLRINGRPSGGAPIAPGDILELADRWVLLVEPRPAVLPASMAPAGAGAGDFAFGRPDAFGLVGESPALWALRGRIAQVARLDLHTLVLGPSGVGKELIARGLSRAGSRADQPFIARSAATIPTTLIDAELFGNVTGYPNPTMKGRPGLIGAADGGVLYLDEIGELPHEAQAHLLRVLDRDGEYQRLGEAVVRRSDLRLVAATQRAASALKPDLLQRFPLRVEVPGLQHRKSDIPLLVSHIIDGMRRDNPELHARGLVEGPGGPALSLDPAFIAALLAKPRWVGHVRELAALVYAAFLEVDELAAGGHRVTTPAALADELAAPPATSDHDGADDGAAESADHLGADAIRAALARAGGNVTAAAKSLGLPNRFSLYRLMRRHDIAR